MTRILIIRFSSIGDIVLTTPVIRMLKQQLDGEVELHFLTKKSFAPLFDDNPYVDKLWTLEDKIEDLLVDLEKIHFEYIVDLHRNLRTAIVKKRLGGMYFSFDKLNFKKWMLVNFGLNKLPDVHIVDRYLDSVKVFGLEDDGKGLDYFIPANTPDTWKELGLKENGFIAWVIGAAHPGKRFSASKIAGIINQLSEPVVLLGGPSDKALAEEILALSNGYVVNKVGRSSLHESASILNKSRIVVTPDTGMMHIASALSKRIVSLWGCTVPEFGMYPYRPGADSVIIQPHGLNKRPCSKLGNRCKYPGNCIEQIDDQEILDVLH